VKRQDIQRGPKSRLNGKVLLPVGLLLVVFLGWAVWNDRSDVEFQSPDNSKLSESAAIPLAEAEASKAEPETDDVRYGAVKLSTQKDIETDRRFHTQRCDMTSEPLREISAGGIVKWTDEKGITHYEDFHGEIRPEGREVVTLFPDTKDYFSLEIRRPANGKLPFSKRAIQQKSTQVYEVYRRWLDDGWLSRAEIRLVFYTDEQQYAAHRDKYVGKESEDVPGFFVMQLNQAVILHTGDKNATSRIMVHEIVHIINNQVFGETPRWLNEGLATYIENLKEDGSTSTLTGQRLNNLKAYTKARVISSVSVPELLSATRSDWLPDKRPHYYQLSQMLMHFLLLPENRDFTLPMFDLLAKGKCSNVDLERVIAEKYDGGISNLSKNFVQWLGS
jgi:hypothetical protein